MTTIISGTSGIQTPSLDLTTPLPVAEGGTGVSTVKPYRMQLATAQATTSGTLIDFTSIPSWVKRITVMFNGFSTNGTSIRQLQLGTSAGMEVTGYLGAGSHVTSGVASANSTTGLVTNSSPSAGDTEHGAAVIYNMGGNTWCMTSSIGLSSGANTKFSGGSKTLAGTLDRIRLTTVNGTDTFDAGSVNVMYEGYED